MSCAERFHGSSHGRQEELVGRDGLASQPRCWSQRSIGG